MKQEDKELFLKDLYARLYYGVHCCVLNLNKTIKKDNDIIYGIDGDNIVTLKSDKDECYMYYQIKPYLRPMSSMTKEENEELNEVTVINCNEFEGCSTLFDENGFDWLNAHHFDYRGLIDKGLALEAPNGMYNS